MEAWSSLQCSQEPANFPYPAPDQSSSCPQPISCRYILILSSHLWARVPSALFPSDTRTKTKYVPLLSLILVVVLLLLLLLLLLLVVVVVVVVVGTAVARWLRCCATNRNVAGSIPDGVTGIFHWHNPSNRTMALGSTQPLTEMSTGSISLGYKGGRCVRLTTLPPSCAVVT